MIAILAVLLAGAIYSYVTLRRAMLAEHEVVASSERATKLLGHMAEDLSRARATALEMLTGSHAINTTRNARLHATLRDLDDSMLELPLLLGADERAPWRELALAARRFETEVLLALELIERGETEHAEKLLDEVADQTTDFFEGHAALMDLHEAQARARVKDSERRLSVTLAVSLAASLVTPLAVLVIWLITMRLMRRQREALARYTARIEHANRDLDAFAGRVAHDLKNILSPIQLNNDRARAHPGDARIAEVAAQRIQRSLDHAVQVLDGLLDFARAGEDAGRDDVASLRETTSAVLDELQPLLATVQPELELDLASSSKVVCGPSLLYVVLLNVIGNAVKFLQDRTTRRVIIRSRDEGATTLLEVEDTGPGIAESDLEHIFEPFYRGADAKAQGHGIGLATVERIVTASGGRIEAESKLGQGTVFRIWFRRAARSAGAKDPLERPQPDLAHS